MSDPVVTIEKLTYGGDGIGHLDGKACFIPFTAPGDIVKLRVTQEKSSYLRGEITDLLTPAPIRITPPCPIFGSCGGCNWQHLDYATQLSQKESIFRDILWRVARVASDRVLPIMPAPHPFGYRSRMQFKLRFIDGALKFGFYRRGSHFVIDLAGHCPIANEACNRALPGIREVLTGTPDPDRIPQVDLATGDDGNLAMVVHYAGDRRRSLREYLLEARDRLPGIGCAFLQSGRKETLDHLWGGSSLTYRLPGEVDELVMSFGAGSFAQVNYAQNRQLVDQVREWAAVRPGEKVLDLYCGNGNFSLPLAHHASQVSGFEAYPPSIADANNNASRNDLHNVRFIAADSGRISRQLAEAGERFDVVIIDPPRTGAREIVQLLPALVRRSLIYISCDPATFARDLAALTKGGLELVCCRPFDMFPQTYHMEGVALLAPVS